MLVAVAPDTDEFPVQRASELAVQPPEQRWLIRSLWSREAVGVVGGQPKVGKTFFGIDVAVSVASATACLDRFPVDAPGPALIYLAEDALPAVRERIEALCHHRRLDIKALDLHVICAPVLRLDLARDQQRLAKTVERLRPRLLLLDPLVRLHRLDENSALEISGLLGYLRELQRAFEVAIVLVHHASKKHRAQPGQALRGSGDIHAFGDSMAYLARKAEQLVLTLEHRAARPPEPMNLQIVSASDGTGAHLAIIGPPPDDAPDKPLTQAVLELLKRLDGPQTRKALRAHLRVNNNRLGDALVDLEMRGKLRRTSQGWCLPPAAEDVTEQQPSLFPP